ESANQVHEMMVRQLELFVNETGKRLVAHSSSRLSELAAVKQRRRNAQTDPSPTLASHGNTRIWPNQDCRSAEVASIHSPQSAAIDAAAAKQGRTCPKSNKSVTESN